MTDPLQSSSQFPLGAPAAPDKVGSGSSSPAQPAGGPDFADVLQSIRENEQIQQETLQRVNTPGKIQNTQDIDRMMNIVDESFKATERVNKTLNAAISAYRKNS